MISSKSRSLILPFFGGLLTLVALACAPSGEDERTYRDPNPFLFDDPRESFDYMEERLTLADSFYTGAIVDVDSIFPVQLVAEIWGGPNNQLKITADGNMAEFLARATLLLVSDGERMIGGRSNEIGFDTTTAPALREGFAVGLSRMGLFNNLTRLYTGNPPDHADGGIKDWVQVHSFEWQEPEVVSRKLTRPMHFTIRIDGVDTAEATLFLQRETGLPLRRVQTVRMADGSMTIEELYTGWAEREAPAGTFDVDAATFD